MKMKAANYSLKMNVTLNMGKGTSNVQVRLNKKEKAFID